MLVKTSHPYEPGREYCVVGAANQSRNWSKTKKGAVDHGKHLLARSTNCDELLVVKVVARIRRATPPIEVIEVK